jgi:excinuclease ABC subunit B
MSAKDVSKEIRRLEKDMLYAAKNLDFEKAASLRDELKKLRESVLFEGGSGSVA